MPVAILLETVVMAWKRWRWVIPLLPVLALGVQTWRLDRAQDRLDKCAADKAAILAASDANMKAVTDQRNRAEAASTAIAKDSQDAYTQGLEAGRAGALRYGAANRAAGRMHEGGLRGSETAAAPKGAGAAVPDALPAAGVVVSEADLQACTDATTYAIEAYNLTQRKIEAGQAEAANSNEP